MFWYLLNIFIIVLAWLWPVNINYNDENAYQLYNKIRTKRTCVIGTINWIILSGLRSWDIGPDTWAYKLFRFDRTLDRSWADILGDFVLRYRFGEEIKDPGYPFLEKIFQMFSSNYQIWLIVIAIIFFVPMGIMVYKYSTNAAISYILFSTLFYSFFAVTGHRQTIATALVVLIGTKYIKECKLIHFLILELVAFTIHASAICFLPFYWIAKININKMSILIYWVAIVTAFLGRNRLVSILQAIVGYEEYGQTEGARASTFLFLLIALAIAITMFFQQYYDANIFMQRISINAIFIAVFFSPLLLINQAFMRVIQYYSLFLLFALPDIVSILKEGRGRKLFVFGLGIVMVILFMSNNPTYSFCF